MSNFVILSHLSGQPLTLLSVILRLRKRPKNPILLWDPSACASGWHEKMSFWPSFLSFWPSFLSFWPWAKRRGRIPSFYGTLRLAPQGDMKRCHSDPLSCHSDPERSEGEESLPFMRPFGLRLRVTWKDVILTLFPVILTLFPVILTLSRSEGEESTPYFSHYTVCKQKSLGTLNPPNDSMLKRQHFFN
jgi:hypothetical protein